MKEVKVKHIFPAANSGDGFYSYFDYMIGKDPKRVYIIKGGPGTGKSSFMKKIGQAMIDMKYDVEYHHCSFDKDSLDGLVIPQLKIVFLDGTGVHAVEPMYPGIVGRILNFGEYWNEGEIQKSQNEIISTKNEISSSIKRAYKYFNGAKTISLSSEDILKRYFNYKDFYKNLDDKIEEIMTCNLDEKGEEKHYFGSALSSEGIVDFYDNLLKDTRVTYIKSHLSEASSNYMKEIGRVAKRKGYGVVFYHNPLNPNIVQTIIIENMNIGFTISHKFQKENHETINLDEFLDKDILKRHKNQLKEDRSYIKDLIEVGIEELKAARRLHKSLEKFYVESMNFDKLANLREDIVNELKGL